MSTVSDAIPQATPHTHGLLRVLGVLFGWSVTLGAIIGAGILRAPGDVAQATTSVPVFFILWLAGALYAVLGALSLAELGTMIPESGGQTVYARRAFGSYAGFAVAWADWISICASVAAIAIVFAESLTIVVPVLQAWQAAIAAGIVLLFMLLQWNGVRTSGQQKTRHGQSEEGGARARRRRVLHSSPVQPTSDETQSRAHEIAIR